MFKYAIRKGSSGNLYTKGKKYLVVDQSINKTNQIPTVVIINDRGEKDTLYYDPDSLYWEYSISDVEKDLFCH